MCPVGSKEGVLMVRNKAQFLGAGLLETTTWSGQVGFWPYKITWKQVGRCGTACGGAEPGNASASSGAGICI